MTSDTSPSTTAELLRRWEHGDTDALERLVPLVLDELRGIAGSCLRDERADHTLQPTALVNELYLKLHRGKPASLADRASFLQFATQAVRRILVDHARARSTRKRRGRSRSVSLEATAEIPDPAPEIDLLALHDALTRLEESSPRRARIVELRFFGGFTLEEVARILEVSPSTVSREWVGARTWLYRELA